MCAVCNNEAEAPLWTSCSHVYCKGHFYHKPEHEYKVCQVFSTLPETIVPLSDTQMQKGGYSLKRLRVRSSSDHPGAGGQTLQTLQAEVDELVRQQQEIACNNLVIKERLRVLKG
jgi:hypothetical protein